MSRFVFARGRFGLARYWRLPSPPPEPLLQPWSCTQKSEDRGWESAKRGQVGGYTVNPFLFIRGLSCPSCIQATLSLNCLKLTIHGCPHNCLPVSRAWWHRLKKKMLGLVLAWKSGLKVPFLTLGRSCPLQTLLLSDLVGYDSPLKIVMAFWHSIIVSRGLSNTTQKVWIQSKRAPNCHLYLQRDVTPCWMGRIALS